MKPFTHKPLFSSQWSPEQASAVYEFCAALADQLWHHYQDQIIEQLSPLNERYDYPEQSDPRQTDLFGFDDSIPF